MSRYKPKGWRGESYRHSLASKGVKTIDLSKYKGKWYEIASIPKSFSKGCEKTTANYTPKENYIEVKNRCKVEGKQKEIIGEARKTKDKNNKELEVSFFPPLFYSPYKIEYVDKDYKRAIVGSKKNSLWLLSRNKTMSEEKYKQLLNIAKRKGYKISELKRTKQ